MIEQQESHIRAGLLELAPDLTPLEQQILEYTWRGYTASMIGAAVRMSTRNIEAYRHRMLKKFGATNTVQMVRAALRQGLLQV
jgi:DNA-binding NarL/FixJ family response regulator